MISCWRDFTKDLNTDEKFYTETWRGIPVVDVEYYYYFHFLFDTTFVQLLIQLLPGSFHSQALTSGSCQTELGTLTGEISTINLITILANAKLLHCV